jgi:hypothetical protein
MRLLREADALIADLLAGGGWRTGSYPDLAGAGWPGPAPGAPAPGDAGDLPGAPGFLRARAAGQWRRLAALQEAVRTRAGMLEAARGLLQRSDEAIAALDALPPGEPSGLGFTLAQRLDELLAALQVPLRPPPRGGGEAPTRA